jgi:hypothetical protein
MMDLYNAVKKIPGGKMWVETRMEDEHRQLRITYPGM